MNGDLFKLRLLRPLQLSDTLLEKPIARLRALTAALPDGAESVAPDLLEDLRQRMRLAMRSGQTFEQATDVKRRESLLISLYTLDLGATGSSDWLWPLNDENARSFLGDSAAQWHPARRRAVTQLFFTQFYKVVPLKLLASMLQEAWKEARDGVFDEAALAWARHAKMLFAEDGPKRLAKEWLPGESVDELADRYYIHEIGRFRESLLQEVLLGRLRRLRFGSEDTALFTALEAGKHSPAGEGRLLGSVAVEIMVGVAISKRVQSWSKTWSQALVTLSCDPRLPNAAERQRWWGWATAQQRDVAVKALTALTIEEFIKLLDGSLPDSKTKDQFKRRRDFLLALFKHGYVTEARLVMHEDAYEKIDRSTRASLMPSRVSGGAQPTSMICLRCADHLFLIEGTHSFGLRGFVGEARFPIRGFWNAGPGRYRDSRLRVSETTCDIYQRHHVGDWVGDFFRKRAIPWARFSL